MGERGVNFLLRLHPIRLQFQEIVAGRKYVFVLFDGGLGRIHVVGRDQTGDMAPETGREGDDSFAMFPQQFPIHPRVVVEAAQMAETHQFL